MGRVQLRRTKQIKEARKRNYDYLTKHLSRFDNLILPTPLPGADICWFSYPITIIGDRGRLLRYLEKKGIETRPLFSGNITRHPAYVNSKFRVSGKLYGSDHITKYSFWISTHPSLSNSDLEYMVKTFNEYFK